MERSACSAAMLVLQQRMLVDGFTVSEFDSAALLTAVLVDQARKHWRRSPNEVARIQSQRVSPRS